MAVTPRLGGRPREEGRRPRGGEGRARAGLLAIGVAGVLLAQGSLARAGDGPVIYRQVCAACHSAGVAGAPRLGDKAAWAARLRAGRTSMIESVMRGKGQMPPKGGNASLSDTDATSALDFMLEQAR